VCDFGLARGITENVRMPSALSEPLIHTSSDSREARRSLAAKKPKYFFYVRIP